MALDSRVASTVPEQQALIAERFAAAYEAIDGMLSCQGVFLSTVWNGVGPSLSRFHCHRNTGPLEVQLRQLTQQAREEQEALTADMEMLRQAENWIGTGVDWYSF